MPEHPVKTRRLELGLRLQDVAAKIGDGVQKVPLLSMVENGYIPPLGTCEKIATALQTTVEKLWPGGRFE